MGVKFTIHNGIKSVKQAANLIGSSVVGAGKVVADQKMLER